ncbi:PAS domain-containing protein [candidate division KSB3 bacterium]|uniref:PAS domain-containing protein n=1 Tax=candidate division KSB3 bacterium TaxID=2044937 RepID=A0A9D5K0B0_9BACT|nr:PAS domain-containing protein [candidate division KSB3 bacterium]MBD3327290.1 PAS domain-containing protein [candidate division KSB3 bacterium]
MADVKSGNVVEVILDSIADGVFTVDKDFRITSFNRAAEEITKFYREEAIGRYCHEIFRANVCFEHCALRETLATGENIINQEINILNSENEEIPVSISTAVLRDKDGRFIGGVETFRDLSLIKQLTREISQRYSFQDIISKHPSMLRMFDILPDIAESNASVLIQGETGTGKELVARAIHNLSFRKDKPLIVVNCGALPDTLLESELFGYVRGAFTDARQDKPGRFQLADQGTIFLDEIGDISPAMQVKLLRVLQEGTFEPLGSTKTVRVDARVIAATSQHLQHLIEAGAFRQDLYYRIHVMRLDIPPLRERKEDIPLLFEHFMQHYSRAMGKEVRSVSTDAMKLLLHYEFPGNVRELQNLVEHALILCREGEITQDHLPAYLSSARSAPAEVSQQSPRLHEVEMQTILDTLRQHSWNKTKTAEALGIDRTTLWRKLKRYEIE